MITARKTYVVSFYDADGHYAQEYYQNRRVAVKRANQLGLKRGKANLSYWIDGAEMVRLARLGYRYNSRTDSVVKSRNAKGFIQEVDAMPASKRESMFLDYRNFRTSDDVVAYHSRAKAVN